MHDTAAWPLEALTTLIVGNRAACALYLEVQLTKNDRFPPVDLCLSQVWRNACDFDLVQRQLILYDIWCRYGVNLKARFESNGYSWPEAVEFLQGIGVWHVYGHKLACFSRYSPLYAHRSGIVDGEIVETLWSLLNRILSSCRGMSLGNRRETIEAAMNDINFKKIVVMSKFICSVRRWLFVFNGSITADTLGRKWKRYVKEFQRRFETLNSLNEFTLHDDRERWEATRRQFEAIRITDPSLVDDILQHPDNREPSIPSTADRQLSLVQLQMNLPLYVNYWRRLPLSQTPYRSSSLSSKAIALF